MLRCFFSLLLIAASARQLHAQTRLSDPNAVAWFNGFGTFYLSQKTALYTEYQWRREGPVDSWQQSLARLGVQRRFGKRTTGILGYGHIATFPYGEYPAGPFPTVEHRIWQQLSWDDTRAGNFSLNHRFRTEQRFIQRIPQSAAERQVDGYNYLNRVRYQLRATLPIGYRKVSAEAVTSTSRVTAAPLVRTVATYLAAYDEVFIGFGDRVGQNIFDQNRVGLIIGHNVSNMLRVEGGYFNQIVQQGAEVQGKEVFQYNHGLVVNAYYTLPAKARTTR